MATVRQVQRARRKRLIKTYFRGRLLERFQKLLVKVDPDALARGNRKPDDPADLAEKAADSSAEDLVFRVAEMRSREILDIQDALRKIKEGTYGTCEECGARIPDKRLEAMPMASLCLSCQQRSERTEASADEETLWSAADDLGSEDGAAIEMSQDRVRGEL